MLEWEWFGKPNTFAIFIYLILSANYKDKKWQGIVIKRGEFVTSIPHLGTAFGLSSSQVRTALKQLTSSGEVSIQTTNKYSIIEIRNYDAYQDDSTQTTHKQQTGQHSNSNKQEGIYKYIPKKEKKSFPCT